MHQFLARYCSKIWILSCLRLRQKQAGKTSNSFLFFCLLIWSTISNQASAISSLPASLPDLPEPEKNDARLLPTRSGSLRFEGALEGTHFSIMQKVDDEQGAPLLLDLATQRIPATTLGWLLSTKPTQTESVLNLGWRFGTNQQLLFSSAQLREWVNVDLEDTQHRELTQLSSGLNYRYFFDKKWLTGIELSGYVSRSPSQFLPASASNDNAFQFITGSNLYGMRLGVETSPLSDTKLHIGFGSERLTYDGLSGIASTQNVMTATTITTNIQWSQVLLPTLRYNASLEVNGVERNLATGVDFNWRDGHRLGVKLAHTRWHDSHVSENAVQFAYTYQFGKKFAPFHSQENKAPWRSSLIPEVLERPSYLPDSVLAKPGSSLN